MRAGVCCPATGCFGYRMSILRPALRAWKKSRHATHRLSSMKGCKKPCRVNRSAVPAPPGAAPTRQPTRQTLPAAAGLCSTKRHHPVPDLPRMRPDPQLSGTRPTSEQPAARNEHATPACQPRTGTGWTSPHYVMTLRHSSCRRVRTSSTKSTTSSASTWTRPNGLCCSASTRSRRSRPPALVPINPPHDAGRSAAGHARLRPRRHHHPLRSIRRRHRQTHRLPPPASPLRSSRSSSPSSTEIPDSLDLHLVRNNYATHKTPDIKRWLLTHPQFHMHSTPATSSWLNLVERWFAELTHKQIHRDVKKSVQEVENNIRSCIMTCNENPTLASYGERITIRKLLNLKA